MKPREEQPLFSTSVSALKDDVHQAVAMAVGRFFRMTGVAPSRVEINMLEVTTFGDARRQYVVGDVMLEFKQ